MKEHLVSSPSSVGDERKEIMPYTHEQLEQAGKSAAEKSFKHGKLHVGELTYEISPLLGKMTWKEYRIFLTAFGQALVDLNKEERGK